jgi:hypothetical protein
VEGDLNGNRRCVFAILGIYLLGLGVLIDMLVDHVEFDESRSALLTQPDERTHWAAVFTAECGFFSAAQLRHLFPLLFPAPVEGVIIRENDDREASYEHVAVNGMVEPGVLLNKF